MTCAAGTSGPTCAFAGRLQRFLRSADGTKQVLRTSPRLIRRRLPLNPAVTIVLPIHNAQRTLRSSLLGLLELAETTGRRMQVAVVDDGSTDATYEIACELASEFPQLQVLRQPYQRGLGAALEQVRSRLGVTDVIAHNGIGEIDQQELALLLTAGSERRDWAHAAGSSLTGEGRGTRRSGSQPALAARLVDAHRSGGAFRWLRIDEPAASRRKRSTPVVGAALDGLMPSICSFGSPLGR